MSGGRGDENSRACRGCQAHLGSGRTKTKNKTSMSKLYFDITEVVRYAKRHDIVTGIQRVELNVIRECIRKLGPEVVRGLIRDEGGQHVRDVDLVFLAEQGSLTAANLLRETGALSTGLWPDKLVLRKLLDPLRRQKGLRALKKVSLYLQALTSRQKLLEMGLIGPRQVTQRVSAAHLESTDVYISLGTGWEDPAAFRVARAHRKRGGKVVQMVHDLIPVVRPDLHMPAVSTKFKDWLTDAADCTSLFLCVSKHTGKDLREFLRKKGRDVNVTVTPLAHEFSGYARGSKVHLPNQAQEAVANLVSKRFVLCVGSLEGRKNITRLLQAWVRFRVMTGDMQTQLVFAGRRGWMIDSFDAEMSQTDAASGSALVIENTTDAELAWLYANSLLTVYPSLYEGWGLPVGESLWFDTPCLASSATSVPEVGGELTTYTSPHDTEMIALELQRLLTDPVALTTSRIRIKNSVLRTWADHATDVIQAIQSHAEVPDGDFNRLIS
jgi:glycosyltransferase involved in cell wall biosynthesis